VISDGGGNGHVRQVLEVRIAANGSVRGHAIDALTTRFGLHGLAIDRILGLPDGSVTVLTRAQADTLVGLG
jgi:hypothetical protein